MDARRALALAVLPTLLACAGGERQPAAPSPSPAAHPGPEVAAYLAIPAAERPEVSTQQWAREPLSREGARRMGAAFAAQVREDMRESALHREYAAGEVVADGERMRFAQRRFGPTPERGHSLYVSLHGGGAVAPDVNDEQWQSQLLRLGDTSAGYRKALGEGVYVAPRAPSDTWDMWFRGRAHTLLERLIVSMVLFEDVDPNRVYLLGYSAGGDGAFRLGPRMADRFAGVLMAAGHPGDADPSNLRNVAFQLQGGKRDLAYGRHREIPAFGARLDALQEKDPGGYPHQLVMWERGHDFPDYEALGWLARHVRNPLPERVVWRQDGSGRRHLYWLAVEEGDADAGAVVSGRVVGNGVVLDSTGYSGLTVRLADGLVDLDREIAVTVNGVTRFSGRVPRTGVTLWRTLRERLDESYMFPAEIRLGGL